MISIYEKYANKTALRPNGIDGSLLQFSANEKSKKRTTQKNPHFQLIRIVDVIMYQLIYIILTLRLYCPAQDVSGRCNSNTQFLSVYGTDLNWFQPTMEHWLVGGSFVWFTFNNGVDIMRLSVIYCEFNYPRLALHNKYVLERCSRTAVSITSRQTFTFAHHPLPLQPPNKTGRMYTHTAHSHHHYQQQQPEMLKVTNRKHSALIHPM